MFISISGEGYTTYFGCDDTVVHFQGVNLGVTFTFIENNKSQLE